MAQEGQSWGGEPSGPAASQGPRQKRMSSLLAGGPAAPALRGLDRGHGKNLLQESSQHRKDGKGSFNTFSFGLFFPPRGLSPGTVSTSQGLF